MPELPEVQTVVNTLRPVLIGRRLARVRLHRQDILTPPDIDLARKLENKGVTAIDRRGKRIVFTLDSGERFYIHLGMSGRLDVQDHGAPLQKHTHLIIEIDSNKAGSELRFVDPRRFGGVWWLGHEESPDGTMGPEPLTIRSAALAKRLSKTTRAIKNALMDQTVLAGLGNIYVDESLFASGIHPLTPANKLTEKQVAQLTKAIKATLRRALRHRGSTLRDYRAADGTPGAFQRLHRVYDRKGKPCAKCKRPIERIVLGGRSTHFCPYCQSLK